MHADIEKFWINAGYKIRSVDANSSGYIYGYKPSPTMPSISRIKIIAFGNDYSFVDGKWYSEEDMLRLIKLIAFI